MDSSPRSTVSSDLYSPSEPAEPEAAPITNGIEQGGSHKRKRDQDPDPNRFVQNKIHSPKIPALIDSHDSADEAPSSRQAGMLKGSISGIRRPSANGHDIGTGADIPCQTSTLLAALWQHIFCFVPPVSLGRMLSVNRAFNTYLTPGRIEEDPLPLPDSIVQPLQADTIWLFSRRRFCSGVPRPIHGSPELDMWKLLKGRACQICNNVRDDATPMVDPQDPWESGPGDTGVQVVWPFGLRCCGRCLLENSQKVPDCQLTSLDDELL